MARRRLRTIVGSQILSFILLCCSGLDEAAADEITPDRTISVVHSTPNSPEWKQLWDTARKHVKETKLKEAANSYAELLRIKPDIEEAIWEYCKVLFNIGDYTRLAKFVAILLENDPYRSEYLLMAGRVAFQDQAYERAIHHFGRVLEKDPAGDHSSAALEGMADSLKSRGRSEEAFILYEQLLTRPNIPHYTLYKVAVEASSLGKMTQARFIMNQLIDEKELDDDVLLLAIEVFNEQGFETKQLKLLKKYLRNTPDNVQLRLRLIKLLEGSEDYSGMVENLSYLVESGVNVGDLLLRGADVAVVELDRPDRALSFFHRYKQLHPTDRDIDKKIQIVRKTLAQDLLAIVENDGAKMLWKDLTGLSESRLEIFKEMADLLEKRNKIQPLIQVLQIILQHNPEKDAIAYRLAQQYRKLKHYEESLKYLKTITVVNRDIEYLLFRGEIENRVGLELSSLHSLEKALQISPADFDLRRKCIQLAGSLGQADTLITLFHQWMDFYPSRLDVQDVITQVRLLGYNYLLQEAETVARWANKRYVQDQASIVLISIELARVERRVGKKRRATQTLRQLLNTNIFVDFVAFELAENAITDKNDSESLEWLEILEKYSYSGKLLYSNKAYRARLELLRGKYYNAQGAFSKAIDHLLIAREMSGDNSENPFEQELRRTINKEYISILLRLGNVEESLELTRSKASFDDFDSDLFVLHEIAMEKAGKETDDDHVNKLLYRDGNPLLTRILAVAEKEVDRERHQTAEGYLKILSDHAENSTLGSVLLSRIMSVRGDVEESNVVLQSLFERFPTEPYYCEQSNYLSTMRAEYDAAIQQLSKCYDVAQDIKSLTKHLVRHENEGGLRLARLLWAQKKHKRSLRLYEKLLSPSITAVLTQQFSEKKINYLSLTREESFWSSMMNLLQSEPEIVEEIMRPGFLMNNLGSDSGLIVAQNYEKYSTQRLIKSEYQAREAVYKRNYSFAEQRYRKLLENEKTTESMADLANIYGRIGEYRKEAKVYEDMKNRGATSPELTDSIERSSRRVKPQNIVDGQFTKKEGRNGYIDLEHAEIGTSFWFIHDLTKDFLFSYANNNYKSVDGIEKAGSNTIFMKTNWELTPKYELTAGVGMDKLNSESNTNILYQVRLDGQLDEGITGFVELNEELVLDTVTSIQEHISARSFSTGLGFDTTFGLAFGGDLRYRSYSDNNSQNHFHGYGAYTIFGESVRLDFRYDFNYSNNDHVNPDSAQAEVNSGEEDVVAYWSPDTFTEHELGLYFQHDFLGYEDGENRKMSYYSLDASIGLEENDTLVYSTKFDIFLEMSPHFLLKGNFSFSTSDEYEETGLSASLHYRW